MSKVLNKNQVVVAMSGGVDSSVAALLLKEQGMEVIGVSMKTHNSLALAKPVARLSQGRDTALSLDNPSSVKKTCCTADDINDARRVCQDLDIPFYAIDFTDEFEEHVMKNFVGEYSQGRTPNPCIQCNDKVKFVALLKKARQIGAYYLATGHYAQKSRDRHGRYHLLRSRDREKDQTYFLFGLGQEQLEHVLFPVGRYLKEEVRGLARTSDLKTAEKPESQEICFVPNNDYAQFIESVFPSQRGQAGAFVGEDGEVLGEHKGIHAYTIGQRRGLGVSSGERLYVTGIEPAESKVVLGRRESLLKHGLLARHIKWVHRESVQTGLEIEVKVRHRHKGTPAVLWIEDDGTVRVEFKQPEGPVTPGQAAVFYQGDEVLGGGWIEKGID